MVSLSLKQSVTRLRKETEINVKMLINVNGNVKSDQIISFSLLSLY